MNKAFSPEELAEIREDWKRNGDLGTEDRLERVAQLHACGPEDIARALDLGKKPEVQAKHIRRRADPEIRQAAVKDVPLEGMTQVAVAEKYGMNPVTIRKWVAQARKTRQEFLDYPEAQKESPVDLAAEQGKEKPWQERTPAQRQESWVREVLEGIRGGERFRAVMEESRILSDEEMVALDQIMEHALIYRDGFEAGLAAAGEELE